ncbi:MAG: response regulator, partial [Acidobacteriota bacterium]
YMWRRDDDHRAEIAFHDGKIVSAWTPQQDKLGDLLIAAGMITPADLASALAEQRRGEPHRTLGGVLIDRGLVVRQQIHQVIRERVQKTIFDLVTWRRGSFHFEIDELNPVDDFSIEPGEVLDDLDLNTQMLLLEATRLFDERNRGVEEPEDAEAEELERRLRRAGLRRNQAHRVPPTPVRMPSFGDESAPAPALAPQALAGAAESAGESPALEALRCQVVSDDPEVLATLRERLPGELVKVVSIRLREAGTRMPGDTESPIVLLDLRHPGLRLEDVAMLARTRPTAPLVALVSDEPEARDARRAGALSAVLEGDETLADSIRNLVRVFSDPTPQGTFGYSAQGGFSRFRRVVFDVQSGLLSATMALNLMHVISESVERAVLFLVQEDELTACGAFGFSNRGEPLATVTRSLRLKLGARGAMRRAIDQTTPQSVDFDQAELPAELVSLLGRPASGQVVLFPVLGAERPISLIYTDNGADEKEIQDIKILELATSQVGVAFENELLRQRLGPRGGLGDDTVSEPTF